MGARRLLLERRDVKLPKDTELLCYMQFRQDTDGRTEQLRPSYSSTSIVRSITSGRMSVAGTGCREWERKEMRPEF